MYKVSANPHLLVERKRQDEARMLVKNFLKEVSEALAPTDISKIMGKYMAKVKDPNARTDFLMQAASFLGRKANVSPEELDLALRQHYAKNYDPAKLARGQTPAQKAGAQAAKQPPPLPQPGPEKKPDFGKPQAGLPPLSKLAHQETEPFWQKQGLPDPAALKKSAERGPEDEPKKGEKEPEGDEDDSNVIPMAKPGDVKSIRPKQSKKAPEPEKEKAAASEPEDDGEEVDMDKFGEKEPSGKEKPAKAEPSSGKKKEKPAKSDVGAEPASAGGKGVPMPSFGSIVKPKLATGSELGDPKWKVGDTVDIGHAGDGYNVKNKTGSWYNLEKGGQKYVFIPFKGLRKVRG